MSAMSIAALDAGALSNRSREGARNDHGRAIIALSPRQYVRCSWLGCRGFRRRSRVEIRKLQEKYTRQAEGLETRLHLLGRLSYIQGVGALVEDFGLVPGREPSGVRAKTRSVQVESER